MKHIKWLLTIVIGALLIIVIAQNIPTLKTPVVFVVNLWPLENYQTAQIPLGFVAAVTFLVGVLLMAVCGIVERFRLKKQIKRLRTEIQEKEKELVSYKNRAVNADVYELDSTADLK